MTIYRIHEPLTAANLNLMNGEWNSYTPTWITTGAGADPTLGNGTLQGFWARHGKDIHVQIQLVWGSTTSGGGAGNWEFGLPSGLTPANTIRNIGRTLVFDAGVGFKHETAIIDPGSTYMLGLSTGSIYSATVPQAWAVTDFVVFDMWYRSI